MIRLEKNIDSFDLYFKGWKVFSHSNEQQCFEIGIGIGKFRQSHASFKVREYVLERIRFSRWEVLNESNEQVIIQFSNNIHTLVVEFFLTDDKLLISPRCENGSINRLWMRINADEDEAIYGCGEQFSELNLRGSIIPIWVEDASPGSRKDYTYYPQPNFISSKNYFCHVETSYYSEFNFKNEREHLLYIWDVPEKIYIGKYDTILDTVKRLNVYLGLQSLIPEWCYEGICLGIQGGPQIVNEKIERARSSDVKVSAVWCQDWQGIRYTSFGKQLFWDWKFEENIYPNLPEYIKSLNSQGIQFLGYINSMLAIEGSLYKEASQKGFCLKNQEGEDYLTMMTDFPAAQTDLSNPEAVKWLKSVIRKNMIGIGLNGWMIDYGEYAPTDAAYHSGRSGEELHNQVPTMWAKLNFELVKEEHKLDEILIFARSGFTTSSKYSMMYFSGDQRVDWDENLGLPSVIPASINLGLCGIGYYHFDIGCYTTYGPFKREKELFMRSAEIGAFSMFMRTHEGNRPAENWQFDSDKETLDHLAKMVKIHVHLKPYLQRLSEEYQNEGLPPIRGLFLHYETDAVAQKIKYQFLLGRDLLIAPVIKPKIDAWKVYLPKDEWIHLWSSKTYKGGWITISAPLGQPPIFYRKKSNFSALFESIKGL